MPTLRCLALVKHVVLDEAGAIKYGFDIGNTVNFSALDTAIEGLDVDSEQYIYSRQIGNRPEKAICAILLKAPQSTIDIAIAHPGVLAMPGTPTDAREFFKAAGFTKEQAARLYDSDQNAFHNNVKAWLLNG